MGGTLGASADDPDWVSACGADALAALGGPDGALAVLEAFAHAVIAMRKKAIRILNRMAAPL